MLTRVELFPAFHGSRMEPLAPIIALWGPERCDLHFLLSVLNGMMTLRTESETEDAVQMPSLKGCEVGKEEHSIDILHLFFKVPACQGHGKKNMRSSLKKPLPKAGPVELIYITE